MKARIKLVSPDYKKLDEIAQQIIEIAKKAGIDYSGPIPLPTKTLKIPVRTAPGGRGRELYKIWQFKIHKRLIEMTADERALRLLKRIPMPKEIHVEIEIREE